ncbi:MAG: hypothetical protein KDD06_13745 [Phaeodactylibacter sp.]|nr:hypothetical protein [Phaeodactylibacter sp.]
MEKEGFDILITGGQNLRYQQNLDKFPIQFVILLMFNNRFTTLLSKIFIVTFIIVTKIIIIKVMMPLRRQGRWAQTRPTPSRQSSTITPILQR